MSYANRCLFVGLFVYLFWRGEVCLWLLKAYWSPVSLCVLNTSFKIMFWVLSTAEDDDKVKTGREKVDVRKWKTWEKWNGPSGWSHITRGLSFQRNHVRTWHLIKEGSLWKLKSKDIIFWAYCWENESLIGSTSLGHSYPECEAFWVKHTCMIKNNIWKKL